MDLGISREQMAAIGDPDYDEFFTLLEGFCPDPRLRKQLLAQIAIPVEGSRGCFAKCDFCQNPQITSAFQTLDGADVARRVQRLQARYGVSRIYFADSVCNSWADSYARQMLHDGQSLPSFMELRVHAPERVFTNLGLAGVNEIQLGVEAVSEPLLKAMRKGTRVWQNLRAVKYLAELGIRSVSNLITHHPRSTVDDVAETCRVVAALSHLARFTLSQFVVSYGSPLWNELTETQRASLQRGFTWLPEDLRPYSTQRDPAYPYPRAWLTPEVAAAWDSFRGDYARAGASVLATLRIEERRTVYDGRGPGSEVTYELGDDAAALLALGHHAPLISQTRETGGLTARRFDDAMAELARLGLVLDLGERYLSLPLRPRSDLVAGEGMDPNKVFASVEAS